LCNKSIYAQKNITDSIFTLKEASISQPRSINFSSGNHTEIIDTSTLNNYKNTTLSDIISRQGNVFIKSYNPSGLSTISMRGTGPAHTAVIWNGVNLQSPMNGNMDLALVNTSFADKVTIQYGGSGALIGSGAVGGAILIDELPKFNSGFNVGVNSSYSSFINQQQNLMLYYGNSKVYSSVKAFYHTAKNNFPFQNTAEAGNPIVRQQNAEILQWGIMQENYFNIKNNQQFMISEWWQVSDRNIPPLMTQTFSNSYQNDNSLKLSAKWMRFGKLNYIVKAFFTYDYQIYNDSISNIFANNKCITGVIEYENRINFKVHQFSIGANNNYCKAISEYYIGNTYQNRTGIYFSYKYTGKKDILKFSATVFEEYVDKSFIPIMPSGGIEVKILKCIQLKTNVSRVYRVPTLNDMYWNPGGNKDLKPEDGFSEDLGVNHYYEFKNFSYQIGITGYNSLINNWIMWVPQANWWTPKNVLQVWSRGLEGKIKLDLKIKKVSISLMGLFNYAKSTNNKSEIPDDDFYKKQIVYVPIYTANASISITWKGLYFMYIQDFTGTTYTSSDNTDYLKPYNVGNLSISKDFNITKFKLGCFVNLNNIWNEKYQIMAWRATPLINYQVGVRFFVGNIKR